MVQTSSIDVERAEVVRKEERIGVKVKLSRNDDSFSERGKITYSLINQDGEIEFKESETFVFIGSGSSERTFFFEANGQNIESKAYTPLAQMSSIVPEEENMETPL